MTPGQWSLRIAPAMMDELSHHLFPGDRDEHGAVIGATVHHTARGTRLLARKVFFAQDGIDYVAGRRGYRMLTAAFVSDCILECERDGLAYLAVHCHGGRDSVAFSDTDLASHTRGYPALRDFLDGSPVGGLVFAANAVAGDLWLPDGRRVNLDRLEVPGIPHRVMRAEPEARPHGADARYDRQSRLFGDRGQEILAGQKVGVIGAGGAGSLVIEYLARLGVGELVVIDPERIDTSNLSRVVGSRSRDVTPWLTSPGMPQFLQRLGRRFSSKKVSVAARVAREAQPGIRVSTCFANVVEPFAAAMLADCDFVFLTADSMQARLVFNAIVHQYLIAGVEVGAKVEVDKATGRILDVFSVIRPVLPNDGCLGCNELISPSGLQEEATDPRQRERQRYVDDATVKQPSVITLNAVSASHATNHYLFSRLGLFDTKPLRWTMFHSRDEETESIAPRHDAACYECERRLGMGPLLRLPTKGRR